MTKTWPGKPGVPLNPERDGWHWLETPDGERVPYEWRRAGECERGRWPSYWVSQGEDCWEAPACKYLGPVLTPDEAAALQKRCEEAERERDALRRDTSQQVTTDEMVRRLQHLGDWQAADRIEALQKRVAELEGLVKILMDSDPWDYRAADNVTVLDVWRKEARAALAGGKDE